MSTNNNSASGRPRPSSPIPIANPVFNRNGRTRSASVSSGSSGSMSPPSDLQTPLSGLSPRITIPSPGSSPILSYFLAQSPTKSQTLPFRKFGTAPVFEDEETQSNQPVPHAAHHARRASVAAADRFTQSNNTAALPDSHVERGAGLLRRLSLSTGAPAFSKSPPEAPPNTAVSPTAQNLPYPRDARHRRATTASSPVAPRAPSPMGERILKGHFDGFN